MQLLGVDDDTPIPEFKDALQKPRPKHDLAAASGRPTETVWGAAAAEDAAKLSEWLSDMQEKGMTRALALMSDAEAAARSPSGDAAGYDAALAGAFKSARRVELTGPDAAAACLEECKASKESRELLLIHCVDGNRYTSLALAQWLLLDYIGGENYLEACDSVRGRYRHSGVARQADDAELEQLMTTGSLSA